jgi:hypothetical protein
LPCNLTRLYIEPSQNPKLIRSADGPYILGMNAGVLRPAV